MEKMISSFTEFTSSSREVAITFLETHQWNLNAAVSTFFESNYDTNPSENDLLRRDRTRSPNLRIEIPDSDSSPSSSDYESLSPLLFVRSRSPSDPSRFRNCLRKKRPGEDPSGCRTLKRRRYRRKSRMVDDFPDETNKDSDEAKEFYDEGEKIGMLVEDPGKDKDVNAVLDKAMERSIESSRSMSGETVSAELQEQKLQEQPHDVVTSTVTIWKNLDDDNPLKSLDDPENAAYLKSITRLDSTVLLSSDRIQVKLIRPEEENFNESLAAFNGVRRTLAGSDSVSTEPPLTITSPPSTSIQLRLADGTRLVTQFKTHHTIRDVRGFIDASRPDDSKDYQLLIMGLPPKPLPDLDQTIEKASIANSVLIQKY